MKTTTLKIITLFSAIAFASAVQADDQSSDTYYDKAKVLSAVPIYTTVAVSIPRRECRQVPVTYSNRGHGGKAYQSATPIVLGGILGAAIGNQFGHGKGKTVGAIAGGILGGSVARDAQYRYKTRSAGHGYGHTTTGTTTHCETIEETHNEERIDGYQVKYRYNGRVYNTVTESDPGRKMRVRVSVVPTSY